MYEISIILFLVILVMIYSYYYITIPTVSYPPVTNNIVELYIGYFNANASGIFSAMNILYSEASISTYTDITTASKYFNGIYPSITSQYVLTMSNYNIVSLFINTYLTSCESLFSAYINHKSSVHSSNYNFALSRYNQFMINIVGYDIQNNTPYDVKNFYGLAYGLNVNIDLITPFGKLCRSVNKNDPNASIQSQYFISRYCYFAFPFLN